MGLGLRVEGFRTLNPKPFRLVQVLNVGAVGVVGALDVGGGYMSHSLNSLKGVI